MAKTKMISKDKLVWTNGLFFTKKGKLVDIGCEIVEQLNMLEEMVQAYGYLEDQPEYQPEPSMDGFKRVSLFNKPAHTSVITPLLDKKIEEAKQIMQEIEMCERNDDINKTYEHFAPLMHWAYDDEILVTVNPDRIPCRVDTLKLGNPLHLSVEKISDLIVYMGTDGEAVRTEKTDDDAVEA